MGSEDQPPTDLSRESAAAGPNTARILLVEDNPLNQMLAKMILERFGYLVDVANNGLEALEIIDRHPFDLVLMDIQMPELDGIETTRRIRASGKPYAQIPIVALTANPARESDSDFQSCGMNGCLAKPIDRALLQQVLIDAIGAYRNAQPPAPPLGQ